LRYTFYIFSITIACLIQAPDCFAQTLKVNLSPKHLSKINESKSAYQKLKKYKKFYSRDSAKQLKKLNRFYKKKYDSTTRALLREQKLAKFFEKKGFKPPIDSVEILNQYAALLTKDTTLNLGSRALAEAEKKALDELPASVTPFSSFSLMDSAALKKMKMQALQQAKEKSLASLPPGQQKQAKEIQSQYGEYSKEAKQYLVFLKDSVDRLDTLKAMAVKHATEQANSLAEGQMNQLNPFNKSLTELKSTPDQYKQQVDDLRDTAKMKEVAKQKAQELLSQNSYIKSVQSKMGLLKNKYSTLLNSNDLSTGIKEKSLKGRPLRERWVIGGNFDIVNISPLMIDLAPQFGYRVNKRFQVGVSGVYRVKFVDSVRVSNAVPSNVYGYSIFATYKVILNFFAYAEFERTTSAAKSQVNDAKSESIWINSALVGIGRQFKIHKKVNGSILLLWNPLHINGKSPYHEAFVIKTGFQLSELSLMKK
jgi:hypothetical protein